MRDARRVGAFFSGLFLYAGAIGSATVLADQHMPRDLAKRLGGRDSFAVIGIESLLIALLIFVVALAWSYASITPGRKNRHTRTGWFLSGVGVGWLAGLIYGAFFFALNPRSFQSMSNLLLASDAPPLWGLLNIVAVISATAWADKLAKKFNPKTPHVRGSSRQAPMNSSNKTLPA